MSNGRPLTSLLTSIFCKKKIVIYQSKEELLCCKMTRNESSITQMKHSWLLLEKRAVNQLTFSYHKFVIDGFVEVDEKGNVPGTVLIYIRFPHKINNGNNYYLCSFYLAPPDHIYIKKWYLCQCRLTSCKSAKFHTTLYVCCTQPKSSAADKNLHIEELNPFQHSLTEYRHPFQIGT